MVQRARKRKRALNADDRLLRQLACIGRFDAAPGSALPPAPKIALDRRGEAVARLIQRKGADEADPAAGACPARAAWALYAGSLRLIVRPEVARFDGLIARISQEGQCRE